MRRAWFAAVVAGVLTLVACDRMGESPEKAMSEFAEARTAGDAARFEAILTEQSRRLLHDLPEAARTLNSSGALTYEVLGREVIADTATLTLRIDGQDTRLRFLREQGSWKLDMSPVLREMKRALQARPPATPPAPPSKG